MRLNQNGISLIELLVAAALTAAVALGGAYVVSQTQRVNQLATTQSDVDRVHYLNLQIARNVSNIQKLYGIDISHNTATDPNFLKCLQMSSTAVNCQQYTPYPPLINNLASVLDSHGVSILTVVPNITSTVTVTPHCTNVPTSYCDYISINVSTSYTGSAPLSVSSRSSVSNLPSFLFVPRNAINYNTGIGTGCTVAGQVMVGIDYTKQTPICGGVQSAYDGSSNTQQLPLLVYDNAAPGAVSLANTTTCPFGYAIAGFGSSSCGNLTADLTAPPPVTTTSTTVPPLLGHWVYDGTNPTVLWTSMVCGGSGCGSSAWQCNNSGCTNLHASADNSPSFSTGAGVGKRTYQCGGSSGYSSGAIVAPQVCHGCGSGNVQIGNTNGSWICTIP